MTKRWKLDAVRALERLAHATEKLAEELERRNDMEDDDADD